MLKHSGINLEEKRKDEEEIAGYDYEFHPQLDTKYTCPICLLALKQPVQTLCGHRFCYHCIITCIRKRPRCPVDQESLDESQIFQDRSTEREVLDLRVKCPHKSCDVITELRYIQAHEDGCEHRLMTCTLGCGMQLMSWEVEDHLNEKCPNRMVNCHNCGQNYLYKNQKIHVTEECEQANKLVQCPHCNREMKRYKIRNHVTGDCIKAPINCVFHKVGCLQQHSRMNICTHMEKSTQIHLQYLLRHVTKVERENNKLTEEMSKMKEQIEKQQKENNKLQEDEDEADMKKWKNTTNNIPIITMKSEPDPSPKKMMLGSNPGSPQLKMGSGVTQLFPTDITSETLFGSSSFGTSCSSSDTGGSNGMTSLGVPGTSGRRRRSLSPCRTSEYETRTEFENKFVKIEHLVRELMVKMEFQNSQMKSLNSKISQIHDEQLLRNCNGVFYWKINNFDRLRREAVTGETPVLNSPGFYTSPWGYRLSIRANLNGVDDVIGSYVSLFIHMMKGDNDDLLTWPFTGTISMTLVNQRQHSLGMTSTATSTSNFDISEKIEVGKRRNLEAFKRCTNANGGGRNDKGYGFVYFCPIRSVQSDGFVMNDSILVKIQATSCT